MRVLTRAGLALSVCLMLCCAACASTQPIVRTKTVEVQVPVIEKVPPALTAPVPDPGLHGDTVQALWDYTLGLQCALAFANAKLAAIGGDWTFPAVRGCVLHPPQH